MPIDENDLDDLDMDELHSLSGLGLVSSMLDEEIDFDDDLDDLDFDDLDLDDLDDLDDEEAGASATGRLARARRARRILLGSASQEESFGAGFEEGYQRALAEQSEEFGSFSALGALAVKAGLRAKQAASQSAADRR